MHSYSLTTQIWDMGFFRCLFKVPLQCYHPNIYNLPKYIQEMGLYRGLQVSTKYHHQHQIRLYKVYQHAPHAKKKQEKSPGRQIR